MHSRMIVFVSAVKSTCRFSPRLSLRNPLRAKYDHRPATSAAHALGS